MIPLANEPDHNDDGPVDDDLGEIVVNDRTCIVTREAGSPETLIRFVAGPNGQVVPDLKRQLPGRGCWIKAERSLVDRAVQKKLFARALKAEAKADADLGALVDRLLAADLVGMMNMARKASQFVTGATKVDAAVRSGAALAVFHAADAAADGVRKIDQARKAWKLGSNTGEDIPSFSLFTSAELDEVMGQNAFIHACALAGQAGEGVVKRANLLEQYRMGGLSQTKGVADMPKQ
ncbi:MULTISPECIES: RNA-binding protein [Neorhizobium]|uniref:RNA-binding protein n=3 Tax=Neorhizobium galegae TaxID=399 RepID=A0A6A1TX29_NEOGA|nr:RNA-binding protein [Neorhizobium galegae]CDN50411.1 Putative nucleic-acid-binding protein implicated in transcription termination [Neorhizobium galegae bv. orientalis str. HAMBI 540]CDN56544.1 Putative nucleic-acid-binding protein implicated in transcription termination [Neorhizobium galegae bv. officinalis bv. officinalis str. HAMBI 1141]CDZ48864.1 Putative nucleic-acid-binding protein implicated in transcription termination [Neorhizobium galegae bv. orientalis]KAB1089028.1 RNA-binding pro